MPDRTPPSDEAGRIVRFRHRRSSDLEAPDDNLAKYEKSGEPDDYRHRMAMNIAGLIVVAVLVGAGLWLVNAIADLRKNQDCALTGRRNCAPIELNHAR
jgi:hypothetical protein